MMEFVYSFIIVFSCIMIGFIIGRESERRNKNDQT